MTRIHFITIFILSLAFACGQAEQETKQNKEAQVEQITAMATNSETTSTEAVATNTETEVNTTETTEKPSSSPTPKSKTAEKPSVPKSTASSAPKPKAKPTQQPKPSSQPSNSTPKPSTPKTEAPIIPKTENPKAPIPKNETPKTDSKKPNLSHDAWNGLLRKYVSNRGAVNYDGFKRSEKVLNNYLQILADNPPLSTWSRNKTMAYWINVYNAATIKLIVDNYPIKSIMELDGGNPWGVKRVKIGGKNYSLNEIEKDLLLKKYKEPRVHFAVNCAAKSCPPLLNRAWTERTIEGDFERQAKNFINNSNHNELSGKSVELSKIFEWYASDFGDVKAYIGKYSNEPLSPKAKISYKEYDWNLNK